MKCLSNSNARLLLAVLTTALVLLVIPRGAQKAGEVNPFRKPNSTPSAPANSVIVVL